MTLSNIESAIKCVYDKIRPISDNNKWSSMTETQLLFELISCILGSQVYYESALAAAVKIRRVGLLKSPMKHYSFSEFESSVFRVLTTSYRFASTKSNYIARTIWALYSNDGTLSDRLIKFNSAQDARFSIVQMATGIGPKQGSLFLRNVGYTDELAILDKHILQFMFMFGLLDHEHSSVSYFREYEKYEDKLRSYASSQGWSLGRLDYAIWIVMRVYTREVKS